MIDDSWMRRIHEDIVGGIVALFVANVSVLGVVVFQHRLMWREYMRRHSMNGKEPDRK